MADDGHSRVNGRVVGIAIAAALGGFLFGFDTAVINGAVDALAGAFDLGDALKGFAVSSALLGCAVGAWFAGQVAKAHDVPAGQDVIFWQDKQEILFVEDMMR